VDRRRVAIHVYALREHCAALEAVSQVGNQRILRCLELRHRRAELRNEFLVAKAVHAGNLGLQAVAAVPEKRQPLDRVIVPLPVRTEAAVAAANLTLDMVEGLGRGTGRARAGQREREAAAALSRASRRGMPDRCRTCTLLRPHRQIAGQASRSGPVRRRQAGSGA
jgi:hypothetical protein